ncbi:MAG: GIY-YIG nuclease family protein [Planctomycetota bacterium]
MARTEQEGSVSVAGARLDAEPPLTNRPRPNGTRGRKRRKRDCPGQQVLPWSDAEHGDVLSPSPNADGGISVPRPPRLEAPTEDSDLDATAAPCRDGEARSASRLFGRNPFDPHGNRPCDGIAGDRRSELRSRVAALCPPVPGVYGMLNDQGDLVYVGKSLKLRDRLLSYFNAAASKNKGGRIIDQTKAIVWETQPSDFAAQLREQDLIRRHCPRMNVQGVPERQRPVYLCLGRKPAEMFFLSMVPPPKDTVAVEGPFFGVTRLRRVVETLNKTFGLRDCSQQTVFQFADQLSLFDETLRPGCLRLEIGTCLGPCAAACSRDAYLQRVNAAESFLDGFNDEPLVMVSDTMEQASANQQYELAASARDTLRSLRYVHNKLDVFAAARRDHSFVYAARGYDGLSVWYLIRCGVVCDVAAAPRDRTEYQAMRERLKRWQTLLQQRHQRIADERAHTVSVVASWFRKHKKELKQTFAPEAAGRRYRHLIHHSATG